MISRVYRKFKLFLKPIKKGDIFYGDPLWFVIPKPVEHVLHGLKDRYGTLVHTPVPSRGCFRFIVENVSMPYYVLVSEVFCHTKNDSVGTWMKRSQPRRMSKEMLEELILFGMLWRE